MLSYQNCTLCPRRCGADRTNGQLGFCRHPDKIYAARGALLGRAGHFRQLRLRRGFFSGCTLKCLFCQNGVISQEKEKSQPAICGNLFKTQKNINLVTPTHFLPSILPALEAPVPVVYNCGGYERVETLRELEGLVDIYLPDMKYSDPKLAGILSAAPDYVEIAKAAIAEMYRQVGSAVIEDEIMQRGMIVRHLMLPGELDNTLGVLDWFSKHSRRETFYSAS